MKLVKFNPARNWLEPFRSDFWNSPRLFSDELDSFFKSVDFNPAIDIHEADGTIRLKADLPGLSEDDIELEVKDNVLTISGEKKREKEEEKDGIKYSERSFGSFRRSFRLPDHVEADKIEAEFRNGVLDVSIPRGEKAEPKKIAVKS